ncbi:hypothetical protein [Sulfurospirillum arcachonense]|uniref:hypothetical protein n=1 Tax=Sulfurospirillum arcachonense TaxID=57666 RepID=UPI00046A6062|nr:hypothetical protein [Sulfurospirillum arcachonense]
MKNIKIVHCANFSESKNGSVYYSIDRKMSNGLIRNGHFVYDFSYREIAKNSTFCKNKKFGTKHVNSKLIETIKNIEPDLLLLGHSELKKMNIEESIIKKCDYLPNFCDESIDTFKAYEQKNHKYDLLLIGRYDKEKETIARNSWEKAHSCFNEKVIRKNIQNNIFISKEHH